MAHPSASSLTTAAADDPLYGQLIALLELGDAKLVGDRYNERGAKEIAVRLLRAGRSELPTATPNAQISIGPEFFTTALRDYEDWPEKWWREAIQNAVDAGAKNVDCRITHTDDGIRVSCQDDGAGMSEDVLLNKFLVLGGTTKVSGTTTGGFGKAKELLVLPWLNWEVHSKDRLVVGSGTEYSISRVEARRGTHLTVLMPHDQCTTAPAAMAFISKCEIKGVRFTVDGVAVKSDLRKGEHIRDFSNGAASLYHNKRVSDSDGARLIIRANGIYMFGLYIPTGVPGMLIVELNRSSVELLTANRDGFRDRSLRYDISDFGNQLGADTRSAVKKKAGLVRERYAGNGKYSSGLNQSEGTAAMLDLQGVMMPAAGKKKVTMSHAQVTAMQDALEFILVPRGPSPRPAAVDLSPITEVATMAFEGLEIRGTTHMENALRQVSWEPDFLLVNEIEGWRVPAKFKPEKMAPRVRQLLRFWAECCRFVLIQLGSRHQYGVGFLFSSDAAAAYVREDGEDWLMLNPFRGGRLDAGIHNLSDRDDVQWLYAAAVHEATHIADGISYHDESFSTALTSNMAKTVGGIRKIAAIRKAVVARSSP